MGLRRVHNGDGCRATREIAVRNHRDHSDGRSLITSLTFQRCIFAMVVLTSVILETRKQLKFR